MGLWSSPARPDGPLSSGSEAVRFRFQPAGPGLRALSQPASPRAAAPGKRLSTSEALCWAPSGCLGVGVYCWPSAAPLSGLGGHRGRGRDLDPWRSGALTVCPEPCHSKYGTPTSSVSKTRTCRNCRISGPTPEPSFQQGPHFSKIPWSTVPRAMVSKCRSLRANSVSPGKFVETADPGPFSDLSLQGEASRPTDSPCILLIKI